MLSQNAKTTRVEWLLLPGGQSHSWEMWAWIGICLIDKVRTCLPLLSVLTQDGADCIGNDHVHFCQSTNRNTAAFLEVNEIARSQSAGSSPLSCICTHSIPGGIYRLLQFILQEARHPQEYALFSPTTSRHSIGRYNHANSNQAHNSRYNPLQAYPCRVYIRPWTLHHTLLPYFARLRPILVCNFPS